MRPWATSGLNPSAITAMSRACAASPRNYDERPLGSSGLSPMTVAGILADQARETLPALMHEVQAFIFLVVPPPAATRTDWMLGFQRRRVAFLDHGRLLPKPGFLSQMSH